MIRLCVVVEGQTEEAFVKKVLGPHLDLLGVFTDAKIVETSRDRVTGHLHKGGGRSWAKWRNNLRRILDADRRAERRVTTMFDLYHLPKDFPEMAVHRAILDSRRRTNLLEQAMGADLADPRFVPYLQRHEFEALVLAGLDQLEVLMGPSARRGLQALRNEIAGTPPEDVDDGVETAPSRRLVKQIGGYDKIVHGVAVVQQAGLPALRAACPRFDAWITQLEALA